MERKVFLSSLLVGLGLSVTDAMSSRAYSQRVHVPAGTYRPFLKIDGDRGAIPVETFSLDAAPTTRGEFLEFVRHHPAWRKSKIKRLFGERSYLADWSGDLDPGTTSLDEPVTYVSWFAARAYCAAQNKRLPTVAEWERAAGHDIDRSAQSATAGAPVRFAMGSPAPDLQTGALVVGNVWEWSSDFNSALVSGRASSRGPASSLFCGDGYRARNANNYAAFLRYSLRSSLRATYALRNLGFRCAQ